MLWELHSINQWHLDKIKDTTQSQKQAHKRVESNQVRSSLPVNLWPPHIHYTPPYTHTYAQSRTALNTKINNQGYGNANYRDLITVFYIIISSHHTTFFQNKRSYHSDLGIWSIKIGLWFPSCFSAPALQSADQPPWIKEPFSFLVLNIGPSTY